jgi:hypothetical protein
LAVHGACQAIEHHDGAKDAVALCAAAFALIATARLAGGGRTIRRPLLPVRSVLTELTPRGTLAFRPRNSAAWLQRFQN